MAQLVTLTQLRTEARRQADMTHSTFVTDEEINTIINREAAELNDILLLRFDDYQLKSTLATIASAAVPLPDDFYKLRGVDWNRGGGQWVTLKQFMFNERNQLQNIGLVLGGYGAPLMQYRIVANELHFTPEDQSNNQQVRLWYTPAYQAMEAATQATLLQANLILTAVTPGAAGNGISLVITPGATANAEVVTVSTNQITVQIQNGVSTTSAVALAIATNTAAAALVTPSYVGSGTTAQVVAPEIFLANGTDDGTIDAISGYDEIVVLGTAIKMLAKEESDVSVLMAAKQMKIKAITAASADRDIGEPQRFTNVRRQWGDSDWDFFGFR